MKKILVPTDFSDCAEYASQVAMMVASKSGASIRFFHIMPNPNEDFHVPHESGVSVRSSEKIHAKNNLDQLVSRATHAGLEASELLVLDKGNEKIEHYIDPLNIDFIVMGSHGASGIREMVIGSNTQRVVRHTKVPVLVVKHSKAETFEIKNILYASTFQGDDLRALDVVTDLVKLWNATLNILFTNVEGTELMETDQSKITDRIKVGYPGIPLTFSSIEANDEEWGIHQFAKLINADIIILATRDNKGSLLNRHVAEELVNHEELPVLVINQ